MGAPRAGATAGDHRWACVHGGALAGDDDLAKIAEGWIADLVVVDSDPSEDVDLLGDVSNIFAVMVDGQLRSDEMDPERQPA